MFGGLRKIFRKVSPFIAPALAFTGVGLPAAIGIGAGAGLLADGAKGALLGGLSGAAGGFGASPYAASLGSALGTSTARAAALGSGLLGGAAGAVGGGGLKGALTGAALSGLSGYAAGGGFKSGGMNSGYEPGAVKATALQPSTAGAGQVANVGTGAAASSYGDTSSFLNDSKDWLTRNVGDTVVGRAIGLGPDTGVATEALASPDYNQGLVDTGGKLLSNITPEAGSISAAAAPEAAKVGEAGMNYSSLLSPLLSAGIGTYTNEEAKNAQLKAQKQGLAALSPFLSAQFNPGDLTQEPGYQFQLEQGNKALDRQQAAKGGYFSGAALKAAQDYGQGLASTSYQNAYQRWLDTQRQKLGVASGIANLYDNMGDIRANAGINTGNVLSGSLAAALGGRGVSNTGNSLGNSDWLMQLLASQRGYA